MNYEVNGNKLYFLIAPARAGKSTYCRDWERWSTGSPNFHNGARPRVVVNADSLRLAMYGQRWNGYMEGIIHSFNEIIIKKYLLMGYDVLVDETNCSINTIKKILAIRNDAIPIVLNTPISTCIRRAYDTNQEDLIPVIQKMFANLKKIWSQYAPMREDFCMIYEDLGSFRMDQQKWNEIIDRIRPEVTSPELRIV
jgi:hypothetical protein